MVRSWQYIYFKSVSNVLVTIGSVELWMRCVIGKSGRRNIARLRFFGTPQLISLVSTSSQSTNVAPQWQEASGHNWIGSDENWVEPFLPILCSWHRSDYTQSGICRLLRLKCHLVFSLRSQTFQALPRAQSQFSVGLWCFWQKLVCVGDTKPDQLIVQHFNEQFITGKCLLGKSKVQGQRRARRFLPTLHEVLRVDTTEAQSLSNWIEIADGRDRREPRASHPTSRHMLVMVKAMCVEALCQAVPCGTRDCKESLISITWSDVRMALPDLDQAWQQALHGLKELSTHTQVILFWRAKLSWRLYRLTVRNRMITTWLIIFAFFDTIDAAEVVVPCADLATPTAPQPSTDVQFEPPRKDIQGFYTIMPSGKHVPRDGHRRHSKKAHIIMAEITDSSFIPYCQSNPFQKECVKMLDTDFSGAAWCQRCIKRWKGQNCATTQSTLPWLPKTTTGVSAQFFKYEVRLGAVVTVTPARLAFLGTIDFSPHRSVLVSSVSLLVWCAQTTWLDIGFFFF